MKALKYFLLASLFVIGLNSCENQEEVKDNKPTEIEDTWPTTISTQEAGDFVLVLKPQDKFTMGDSNLVSTLEKTVTIEKSFYMCKTEVTQAQWKAIMKSNPSDNEFISQGANTDNCPVNNITYSDAKAFVKALNEATGRKFAIPTEQQWEWAAIGGRLSNGYTYSGSNNHAEVAWSSINQEGVLNEVAKLKANELGIYDMSGNVDEWTTTSKLTRGGNYETKNTDELNVRYRNKFGLDASYSIGLRLIIEEPLSTEISK